jgi:vancomycin resistance protein YoaR
VSQVATTFFNAAWFAGIELVDHQPHSQYLDRYPPGREATIAWQLIDVVVHNDTPFPIEIATSHSESEVTVTFIGTPWFEVTETWDDAPAGVTSGDAFSVSYGRTVAAPDGSSSQDAFSWTYEAS